MFGNSSRNEGNRAQTLCAPLGGLISASLSIGRNKFCLPTA